MPEKEKDKYYEWITRSAAAYDKVDDEYTDARNYYENEQAPSDVPSDKEYIQENIITDTIDRSVGQVVSGEIKPILVGGGPLAKAAKELHDDILEANHFKELILPDVLNKFYNEGFGSIKFVENPFEVSRYGIGFPKIYEMEPGDLLLDPNSRTGMHYDDIFHIHRKRMLKSDAVDKWGKDEDGNVTELGLQIQSAQQNSEGDDTEEWVEIQEIEYRQTRFFTEKDENGNTIKREQETYYITKRINDTVEIEPPRPTGYPTNRMIEFIHTARKSMDYGRYPFGLYKKLGQSQDQLNVTSSVMLDGVKSSIKNLIYATGLREDEEARFQQEATKTNGFFSTRNPQARIDVIQGKGIARELVQWHQLSRDRYDDIKGSSNQAQQFSSAASGQLSGKAINSLQFAGVLPEYTKKANIEYALKRLSMCIFHYIKKRMLAQFTITRSISGSDRQIMYNTEVPADFQGDEYNVVTLTDEGKRVVNDLSQLGEFDVKIEVEMNTSQRQDVEMNKALLLAQMQKISDEDLLKAMYPNDWKDKFERMRMQQGAMGLIQQMVEIGGEDFINFMAQQMQQFKGMFKDGEYQG